MIREFPPDWAPAGPPPPLTRLERFVDHALAESWDQIAVLVIFVLYVYVMAVWIGHMA